MSPCCDSVPCRAEGVAELSVMVEKSVRMQAAYVSAILAALFLGLICMRYGNDRSPTEKIEIFQSSAKGPMGRWGVKFLVSKRKAREQLLWGGNGLVTTGDYVDGRKTVPGLHTDCIPGVLRSDCSPAQEDGAWSKEAAAYIDQHTNGKHSETSEFGGWGHQAAVLTRL
eukprot:766552-Hanusia_phi.AAC.2